MPSTSYGLWKQYWYTCSVAITRYSLDVPDGERVEGQGQGHGPHPQRGQGQEAGRGRRDVRATRSVWEIDR